MKIYIYGLYEEGKENEIRYVGKTNKENLNKRLQEHIYQTFRTNKITHKNHWIKSIINKNNKINIKLIEETNINEWKNREKYWISFYENLTNTTEGGEGGHGLIYTITYDECKKYIKENFKISSGNEWGKKSKLLPYFIPKNPQEVYLNRGWVSWGDFLETNRKQDNLLAKQYLSYDDAKEWIKINLNYIKTQKQWKENTKNDLIPYFIPNRPERYYLNKGWIGWGNFLGTNRTANQNKKHIYLSYDESSLYAKENNIKSISEWKKNIKNLPYNIPRDPRLSYKNKGWIDWGEFLGTGKKQDNLLAKQYLSYENAKEWVKYNLNIKSKKEWMMNVKNNKIPIFIPNHPELFYNKKERGWLGWKDFLLKTKKGE